VLKADETTSSIAILDDKSQLVFAGMMETPDDKNTGVFRPSLRLL
jgi:hypothetical protein